MFFAESVWARGGQLHDDGQVAFDFIDALDGQHERMPHFLDALHGLVLLLGPVGVAVHGVQVAVNEFDRFENVARRQAFPDFPESPGAQGVDEAVTRNRLRIGFAYPTHGRSHSLGAKRTGGAVSVSLQRGFRPPEVRGTNVRPTGTTESRKWRTGGAIFHSKVSRTPGLVQS